MKKIILASFAVLTFGIAPTQADSNISVTLNANVEAACTFGSSFTKELGQLTDSADYSFDLATGSSCNTMTQWTVTSANQGTGLTTDVSSAGTTFANNIYYVGNLLIGSTSAVSFNSSAQSAGATTGEEGGAMNPFSNKTLSIQITPNGVSTDTNIGGNYSDVISIDIAYI